MPISFQTVPGLFDMKLIRATPDRFPADEFRVVVAPAELHSGAGTTV
jgi:hypothetical protein